MSNSETAPPTQHKVVLNGKHYTVTLRPAHINPQGKSIPAKTSITVERVFPTPSTGWAVVRSLTPVRNDTRIGKNVLDKLARQLAQQDQTQEALEAH